MFNTDDQPTFTLSMPELPGDVQVLAFNGHEALNRPYAFSLELVSEHPALDLQPLLQKPAFLAFAPQGHGIHGLVDHIAQGDSGPRLTRYEMILRPQLARLRHRRNQRIFQAMSVPQIIRQVLAEHGILGDACRFHLGTAYPARDYCVQYAESDLHFIQRLCEEEGLSYHFQHSADAHLLVFGDDQTVFPRLAPTRYRQGSGLVAEEPAIERFKVRLETRATRATRQAYNFEKPRLELSETCSTQLLPDLEDYRAAEPFDNRNRGQLLASRSVERHRADHQQAEGSSDEPGLASGHFLPLREHPRPAWNDLWLLTEVHHQGRQSQVLEEATPSQESSDFTQGYRNRFLATPWEVPFRPALNHPKPRLAGSQSAIVTGPAGQDIHCDRYGRVKVQFQWDREGPGNERSSCWLRVAQGWAGERHGGLAIPRVGMEVLVSFLEGDPDQPLVTGCLYHAEHLPPYELPTHKTRSVFRTRSSPPGGGFNELHIEDKQGQELIFIRAQRDWNQVVGQHHTLSVKASQRTNAGTTIQLQAGQNIAIDAGTHLTLSAGGHWLRIDSSGITSSVEIQRGVGVGGGLIPEFGGLLLATQRLSLARGTPACAACEARAHEEQA